MKIEYFLERTCKEFCNEVPPEYELYKEIENEKLRLILSTMHSRLNVLFRFMYAKSQPNSNYHFNAEQSRELIEWIDLFRKMEFELKDTELDISINDNYKLMMNQCRTFLMEAGGSKIPVDLLYIEIIEYDCIFFINDTVRVPNLNNIKNYKLKQIGFGSYANVYRYRDEFYNKDVIIKRAKTNELNEKELIRFKQEFEILNELKSPYVIKVYKYDEEEIAYYMESADETLKEYITRNNSKLERKKRLEIAYQILKAINYIHSKGHLHRDLSLTNVLLFHYEDISVVKLSDFGLVKLKESDLTSINSEFKGSLNDPLLVDEGFASYSFEHEVYALTRLILFVLTGKTNLENLRDSKILNFVRKGTNPDKKLRFKSIEEFKSEMILTFEMDR